MKISVLAAWLWVAGLLVAVVLLFRSNQQKDAELASARESVQQVEQVRQTLEQLETTSATQSNQLAELRNQQSDLLRLRNEVSRLREENQRLAKQVQTGRVEAQRLQVQAQTAQAAAQRAQAQANQLAGTKEQGTAALDRQAEYQSRIKAMVDANALGTPQGQAAAACINNLRLIDGAKQQWALENNKALTDTPTWDDLRPYFRRTAQALSCPDGGTYSINVVTAVPTCSVPGHALPR
jgi:TolA-binding protein